MDNKCLTEEQIARYLDGLASPLEKREVLEHCRTCEDCTNEIISLRKLEDFLQNQDSQADKPVIALNNAPDYQQIPYSRVAVTEIHEFKKGKKLHKQEINQVYLTTSGDTCAIRAQQIILRDFNIHLQETTLLEEAIQHHWYIPGKGTLLSDTGKLLELHGLEVDLKINVSIDEIIHQLHQGCHVIVGVDSGELWAQTPEEIRLEQLEDEIEQKPDHVLIVLDIEEGVSLDRKVLVKDTGQHSSTKKYGVSKFLDAWQDSDFFMVVARLP